MSKISLGYDTNAEIKGDELTLSFPPAPGDLHEITLERRQLLDLIRFATKEGFVEPMVALSAIEHVNMNLKEALETLKKMIEPIHPIHLGQGKPVRVPAYFDEGESS
jgi:hypothetical protein